MPRIRSNDAEIAYEVLGKGAPIVMLHPFPAHHGFWLPAARALLARYRLILPDLRGHGDSDLGEGLATMQKHAQDLARVMDDADVSRAPLIGVSIGGYAIFEFCRQFRGRATALVLCNTKASADSSEARTSRLQAADEILQRGTEPFFQSQALKLFGKTTQATRPDLIDGALRMMRKMSAEDVAMVQRGMAERSDSVETLKTIDLPTLILAGEEDTFTPVADAEVMRKNILSSELTVVARAGHYTAWEQPEEVGNILRQFLDRLS